MTQILSGSVDELRGYKAQVAEKSGTPCQTMSIPNGRAFVLVENTIVLAYLELQPQTRLLYNNAKYIASPSLAQHALLAGLCSIGPSLSEQTLRGFIEDSARTLAVTEIFAGDLPALLTLGFTIIEPGISLLRVPVHVVPVAVPGPEKAVAVPGPVLVPEEPAPRENIRQPSWINLLPEQVKRIPRTGSNAGVILVGLSQDFVGVKEQTGLLSTCFHKSQGQETLLFVDPHFRPSVLVELQPRTSESDSTKQTMILRTLCFSRADNTPGPALDAETRTQVQSALRETLAALQLSLLFFDAKDQGEVDKFLTLGFLPALEQPDSPNLLVFDPTPQKQEEESTVKKVFSAYRKFRELNAQAQRESGGRRPGRVSFDAVRSECVFIGKSSAGTSSNQLMSYCFDSEACSVRFCFSLPELEQLVAQAETAGPKAHVPFPYKQQIEEEARKRGITLHVSPTLDPTFIAAVKTRVEDLLLGDERDEPLAHVVTEALTEFLKENPQAMNEGSFLQQAGHKVLEWSKWILRTGMRMIQWVAENPFWSSVALHMSKIIRLMLCALMSGVKPEDFKFLLTRIYTELFNNPLLYTLVTFGSVLYNCAMDLATGFVSGNLLGWVASVTQCFIKTVIGTGTALLSIWNWVARALAWVVRFVFSSLGKDLWGEAIARGLECTADITGCLFSRFMSSPELKEEVDKEKAEQQEQQGQTGPGGPPGQLVDFSLITFYLVLALIPATVITDWIRANLNFFTFTLYGKIGDALSNAVQRTLRLKTAPSLLDAFLVVLRFGGLYKSVSLLAGELYGWFIELLGCSLKYFSYRLGFITEVNPVCCFEKEVRQLQDQAAQRDRDVAQAHELEQKANELKQEADVANQEALAAQQRADAATKKYYEEHGIWAHAHRSYDEETSKVVREANSLQLKATAMQKGAQEAASRAQAALKACDPRLKVVVRENVRTVDGFVVNEYRWNRSNKAKSLWKSVGLVGFPKNNETFFGVSAQCVQQRYPHAVAELGAKKLLFLKVDQLSPELREIFADSESDTFWQ